MELPKILKIHENDLCDVVFSTNIHGSTFLKDSQDIMRVLSTVNPQSIRLKFECEETNEFDKYATIVYATVLGYDKYQRIGYVPKDISDIFYYVLHSDNLGISYGNLRILGGTPEKENYGMFFDFKILQK